MGRIDKRKLYGGVLGLCAVALLLDRALLAPQDAAAQETATTAASLAATPAALPEIELPSLTSLPTTPAHRFSDRLQAIAGEQATDAGITDAFASPQSWEVDTQAPITGARQSSRPEIVVAFGAVETLALEAAALESGGTSRRGRGRCGRAFRSARCRRGRSVRRA